MICPNCGTPNDPHSRFCIKCGQTLDGSPANSASGLARSHPGLLAVLTARLGIALLLLWMLRSILLRLPFTRGIRLPPEVPLSLEEIITAITYLVALFMLLAYAQAIWSLWPQAFPRHAALTPALAALVYVAVLVVGYHAFAGLILTLTQEPEFLLVLRVVLLVLAAIFLIWAGVVIYNHLPAWIASLRFEAPSGSRLEIACLNCGRLNPANMKYCGHCGKPLVPQGVIT